MSSLRAFKVLPAVPIQPGSPLLFPLPTNLQALLICLINNSASASRVGAIRKSRARITILAYKTRTFEYGIDSFK